MGVKITEIVAGAKKLPAITDFAGKKIAIDAFNWLYQFLAPIRLADGSLLQDKEGKSTSHLSGFFYRNVFLLENRIKPVYVFDGVPSELKSETIRQRVTIREEAKKKSEAAKEAGEMAAARRYATASSQIEPHMIPDCKRLFELMGIPYIEAPSEGEAQATHMVNKNDVFIVASQDYDCFLFGARTLLRNLTQQEKRTIRGKVYKIEMESYLLDDVLQQLEITQSQLVDLGILTGTDFNDGIHGVGQKTALKLIKEHGSIEAIYEQKPEYAEQLPLDLVERVRKIFLEPNVTDDYSISASPLDAKGIMEFMCTERNFNEDRIKTRIIQLEKILKKASQQSLDSFFK
ncbi:MAG TPA: flap endonuclease-1 [Candidatus Lokiarchaeia archaeon]|nr:flap endonuclease-1 [Candidatus Lokiarchaeia archaeon]